MNFYINVNETKVKEFLQIVRALQSLGVIESFKSPDDLIREEESGLNKK